MTRRDDDDVINEDYRNEDCHENLVMAQLF